MSGAVVFSFSCAWTTGGVISCVSELVEVEVSLIDSFEECCDGLGDLVTELQLGEIYYSSWNFLL